MLPLVTEFSIILPEFSLILPEFPRFFKILGGCDTPPHPPVATPLVRKLNDFAEICYVVAFILKLLSFAFSRSGRWFKKCDRHRLQAGAGLYGSRKLWKFMIGRLKFPCSIAKYARQPIRSGVMLNLCYIRGEMFSVFYFFYKITRRKLKRGNSLFIEA